MFLRYCLSILCVLFILESNFSQCSTDASIEIVDLVPTSQNILINGAVNDDLSGNQALVGVLLEFEHTQVGDLTIELTSPSGQSVVLLGPIGSFGNTSLTDWEVLFVPCANPASPDPGFSEEWSNNQDWGSLGDYTGSYYPFSGCLEDFNSGSINGNWNIMILDNNLFDEGDLLSATLFFADPNGLDCDNCSANAGTFDISELSVCTNSNENINLLPNYIDEVPGLENDFLYVISQNDLILTISPVLNMSSFGQGVYQVCGISVLNSDVASLQTFVNTSYSALVNNVNGQSPTICADLNTDCVTTTVSQSNIEVDLDITICEGDGYTLGDETFTMAGDYEVIVPQPSGCDSVYNLMLSLSDIEAIVSSSNTMLDCASPSIIINSSNSTTNGNTQYLWTSIGGNISGDNTLSSIEVNEAGTYILTLIDGNCESTAMIEIFASSDAAELSITGGTITCLNPSVDIDLESNLPISDISWDGPNGFSDTDEDITVTEPGAYTATVTSDNGCVSIKSIIINEAGSIPVLSLFAEEITCGEPLVAIQVSTSIGSFTYDWTGPNGFTSDAQNPIVGEPGIYEVTATDDFGCSDVFQIEVMGDPGQFEYNITSESIVCPNGSGTLEVILDNPNAGITWTSPSGQTSNNNPFRPDVPGVYDVTILSNGCEVIDQIELLEEIGELPVIEVVQDAVIGCMDTEATLSLNVISGNGLIDSIIWDGPSGLLGSQNSITASVSGDYRITVFTEIGCPVRYTHELMYAMESPEVDFERQNVNCAFNVGFQAAIPDENLTYQWTDQDNVITTDSIVTSTTGNIYCLEITNDLGCVKKYLREITIDTSFSNDLLGKSNDLSCDDLTSTFSFATFRFSEYNWFDENYDLLSSESTYETSEPGEYFLELVDASSLCIDTVSIELLIDTLSPDLQAENQSFDCLNNNLLVQIDSDTENVTYSWSGPDNFMSNQKSPLVDVEGDYTVTVTAPNGCTTSKTITLLDDGAIPDLDAEFSNELDCINTQATLTALTNTPGASFIWIGPNNVFDQGEILVDVAGIYELIATGQNGCSDTIEFELPFTGDLPVFEALGDTLFCGETDLVIDINETTPNVTYEWSGPNGYSSSDIQNIVTEEGLYILLGTDDDNNCVSRDTAFILIDNEDPIIELNEVIDTLDCNTTDLTYSFNSDRDYISVEWENMNSFMSTDSSIIIDEPGLYTLTVVAENNCETDISFTIEQDILEPDFEINNEDINCDNQKADVTIDNDDLGSTYSWVGPNFLSDLQNIVAETEGDYTVTVTGSNGCTSVQTIVVDADLDMPNLMATNDTLDCTDDPILLTATSTTDDVVIQWLGPNGFDSTGVSALTDLPGDYFVIAVGPNGCETQIEIEVSDDPVFPDVSMSFSNTINCEFDETTITATTSSNVVSTMWASESGFTTNDLEFTTAEAGTFIFAATGDNGCITFDSIEVEIDTLYPDVVVNQVGRILCDINSVSINGEGSAIGPEFSYSWSTDDGLITFGENTLNPIIEGEGTYLLAIENDNNGCINTETLVIEREQSTLESMDVVFNKQTCADIMDGEIIISNVVGGVQPLRYGIEGASFTEDNLFDGLFAGDYLISVRDSFGCVLDSLVTLEEKFQVTIDLGNDIDVFLGEEVNIQADINFPLNQITSIEWAPAGIVDCVFCTEFDFVPGNNTQVTAWVTDENGCTDQDQLIIRVDDETKLYVPNIFTPNQDGVNDMFFIPESPNVSLINSFRIYDRWGTEVWEDADFVPGSGSNWDGRHLNQNVLAGVYFYVAEIVMVNDEVRIIRGNVTITR